MRLSVAGVSSGMEKELSVTAGSTVSLTGNSVT